MLIEDVTSHEAVTDLAERILESLRQPVRLATKTVSAAGSIGIAFDEEGITSEQLLRNADIAMYQAKKRARTASRSTARRCTRSVAGPHRAGGGAAGGDLGGDLVAHYQPIVDLQTTGSVGLRGAGALAPPRGAGSSTPADFVPLAKEIGLIGEIDSFILSTACRQVREWQETGVVRPRPRDRRQPLGRPAGRRDALGPHRRRRARVQDSTPARSIIEITESEVLTDDDATVRNLAALRRLGVRIALDDFGTGYSSLRPPRPRCRSTSSRSTSPSSTCSVRGTTRGAWPRRCIQLAHTLGLRHDRRGRRDRRAAGEPAPRWAARKPRATTSAGRSMRQRRAGSSVPTSCRSRPRGVAHRLT